MMQYLYDLKNRITPDSVLFWVLQFAGWTIAGFAFYFQASAQFVSHGATVLAVFVYALFGFTLTLLFRIIIKKIREWGWSIWKLLPTVLILSFCGACIWLSAQVLFTNMFNLSRFEMNIAGTFLAVVPNLTIVLFAWATLYIGIKIWRDYEIEKTEKLLARNLAQEAELKTLRYQINPHFLFNVLNSIRSDLPGELVEARDKISRLSEYFRYSLEKGTEEFVSLGEEVEAIENYLSIEKSRFGEKLEIDISVPEELKHTNVLAFALQPLVENAIKYGFKTSPKPLRISISVNIDGEYMIMSVKNSGRWISDASEVQVNSTGIGLNNIKKRMNIHYPNANFFKSYEENGWVVIELGFNFKSLTTVNHV